MALLRGDNGGEAQSHVSIPDTVAVAVLSWPRPLVLRSGEGHVSDGGGCSLSGGVRAAVQAERRHSRKCSRRMEE